MIPVVRLVQSLSNKLFVLSVICSITARIKNLYRRTDSCFKYGGVSMLDIVFSAKIESTSCSVESYSQF